MYDMVPAGVPKTVLIIEDNPLSLKMMRAIIEADGHVVLEAKTGLQGLELARQHHPALIVTDIRLPDISGLEVARMLKAEVDTTGIPIIGTSAHAAADDKAIYEANCEAFMPKPISIADFVLTLHRLIIHAPASGDRERRSCIGSEV